MRQLTVQRGLSPYTANFMGNMRQGQAFAQDTDLNMRQQQLANSQTQGQVLQNIEAQKLATRRSAVSSAASSGVNIGMPLKQLAIQDPVAAQRIFDVFKNVDKKAIGQAGMAIVSASQTSGAEQTKFLEEAKRALSDDPLLANSVQTTIDMPPGPERDKDIFKTALFINNSKSAFDEMDEPPMDLTRLINEHQKLAEGDPKKQYYADAIQKESQNASNIKRRPFLADLMAKGWMPGTRITGPLLDAFEAAATKAAKNGTPLSVADLHRMEYRATENRKKGSTAASAKMLNRKQNLKTGMTLLTNLTKTANAMDYSHIKFIGKLQSFRKGQLNDPVFTEYMSQRADALFVLTAAMKQNGVTDKAIEIEMEAAPDTMSPKAFAGWVNAQMTALNESAERLNEDFGYGIQLQPIYPAGQGGLPSESNPVPRVPGAASETGQILNFDAQGNLIQ